MIPNMPAIGIRFDIGKVGSGYYGFDCWKIFWRAVDPEAIKGSLLFEGDTAATLSGKENVFCTVVQSADASMLKTVKGALAASEEFKRVCAGPMFVEGANVTAEPLADAGRIDQDGDLVGEAHASRSALGAVRRERRPVAQAPGFAAHAYLRTMPASERTRDLPELSSFEELQGLFEKVFKPKEWEYADYWLTPEELCDVVEKYGELIEVQWSEYACPRSEDLLCVRLFQKDPPEGSPLEFHGLFPFPSDWDAAQLSQEYRSVPAYAAVLPTLAGIRGKYQLNFGGKQGNPRNITYEGENEIPPHTLWEKICARRERLGIPAQEMQAPEERERVSPEETSVSGTPVTREPRVICPKCQAQNLPNRATCSQCGAKLLPGRGILSRIGYLIGGVVLAAVFVGLAWLLTQAQMEDVQLPDFCGSPYAAVFLALACLVGGLRMGFSRTPEYEKYVRRAQRHAKAAPKQALADFDKALELAPKKKQAGILKQRGELYSKLGRKEEALADLSTYAAAPDEYRGSGLLLELTGGGGEPVDYLTKKSIEDLQKDLVQEGALKGIGYCKRCKDAVELDEARRCSRCGGQVKEARFVKPWESGAELAKIRKEVASGRRRKVIGLAVGGVALLTCGLCGGMGIWSAWMRGRQEDATATAAATAAPTTFAENVFSFEYPSNWDVIMEEEVDALLETSLKGLRPGSYDYIGGVYTGGIGECQGCAQIVIVVAKDPSLTGTLTDEQYEQVKEAAEEQMGSRLISHRLTEVSSMPAVESVHIGASGRTKVWELIIVPPEPGVAYLFSCSSHKDSYADFEPTFERAIGSLRVGELAPEATVTPGQIRELTPEPTVDTSGCTFGAVFREDVTVPDNTPIEAGQPFTKTWRIRNTGTCPWTADCRLTFVDGDQMGGPDSVDVPETPAGEDAEISVQLIAPTEPGQYRGYWQMCVEQSDCFGDRIYVQIVSVERR